MQISEVLWTEHLKIPGVAYVLHMYCPRNWDQRMAVWELQNWTSHEGMFSETSHSLHHFPTTKEIWIIVSCVVAWCCKTDDQSKHLPLHLMQISWKTPLFTIQWTVAEDYNFKKCFFIIIQRHEWTSAVLKFKQIFLSYFDIIFYSIHYTWW